MATTKSTNPGWLPVVGGPCDGMELYGFDHLRPGDKVVVRMAQFTDSHPFFAKLLPASHGSYVMSVNGERFEWKRG